jgi:ureidoacrylate peracid hydrolase
MSGSRDTALIVIDMQRQFTTAGAPFEVDGADALVQRVATTVHRARSNGVPVIWVSQRVRPNVGLGRTSRRYGQSDIHRGELAELDGRLDPGDDILVLKHRQSAFFGTDLETVLRGLGIDTVILSGVTTNVCVLATAIDAGARDFGVVLASDLTAALPVRRNGHIMLEAADVQRAAEAFVIHAVGEVALSPDIAGLGQ